MQVVLPPPECPSARPAQPRSRLDGEADIAQRRRQLGPVGETHAGERHPGTGHSRRRPGDCVGNGGLGAQQRMEAVGRGDLAHFLKRGGQGDQRRERAGAEDEHDREFGAADGAVQVKLHCRNEAGNDGERDQRVGGVLLDPGTAAMGDTGGQNGPVAARGLVDGQASAPAARIQHSAATSTFEVTSSRIRIGASFSNARDRDALPLAAGQPAAPAPGLPCRAGGGQAPVRAANRWQGSARLSSRQRPPLS